MSSSPADLDPALLTLRVVSVGLAAGWVAILFVELWGLVEFSQSRGGLCAARALVSGTEADTFKMRMFLLTNTVTTLFMLAMVLAMAFDLPMRNTVLCNALGKLAAIAYCFAVQFVYLFFIAKAHLVGRFETSVVFRWFSFAIFWFSVLGIPFFLAPLCAVYWGGAIEASNGMCVGVESAGWLSIFFVIANFGLSISLLLLFIIPLRNNARAMSKVDSVSSNKLWAVARSNANKTAAALLFTTGCVIYVAIAMANLHRDSSNTYYMVWGLSYISLDATVNGLTAKSMSYVVWMPKRLLKWTGAGHHSDLSSSHQAPSPSKTARVGHMSPGSPMATPGGGVERQISNGGGGGSVSTNTDVVVPQPQHFDL